MGNRYYSFNARAGDRIRVGIAWSSQADCPSIGSCNNDTLLTDFDVILVAPDGNTVGGGVSGSYDNNYEVAPKDGPLNDGALSLSQTGTYRIRVFKARFNETTNFVGVAWTKVVLQNQIFLPFVRR